MAELNAYRRNSVRDAEKSRSLVQEIVASGGVEESVTCALCAGGGRAGTGRRELPGDRGVSGLYGEDHLSGGLPRRCGGKASATEAGRIRRPGSRLASAASPSRSLDPLAHPGGVDPGVNDQMGDVDVLWAELARRALRHRTQAELGAGEGCIADPAAHAGGGPGKKMLPRRAAASGAPPRDRPRSQRSTPSPRLCGTPARWSRATGN
jgi:hypothetical protein